MNQEKKTPQRQNQIAKVDQNILVLKEQEQTLANEKSQIQLAIHSYQEDRKAFTQNLQAQCDKKTSTFKAQIQESKDKIQSLQDGNKSTEKDAQEQHEERSRMEVQIRAQSG
ncbi:MAG: hypothetical protein H7249_17750 [Chitinophagaceae bacterium]|nr:hypothetical protein [Oligoflexus sp.]